MAAKRQFRRACKPGQSWSQAPSTRRKAGPGRRRRRRGQAPSPTPLHRPAKAAFKSTAPPRKTPRSLTAYARSPHPASAASRGGDEGGAGRRGEGQEGPEAPVLGAPLPTATAPGEKSPGGISLRPYLGPGPQPGAASTWVRLLWMGYHVRKRYSS